VLDTRRAAANLWPPLVDIDFAACGGEQHGRCEATGACSDDCDGRSAHLNSQTDGLV
jgi:hypothetical protein